LPDGSDVRVILYQDDVLSESLESSSEANDTAAGMELWTANSEGQPTMKGTATW